MKLISKVYTNYNATAPKYNGYHSEALGATYVIEDRIYTLGLKLTERGEIFKKVAKDKVLVDTGRLRDSIGVKTLISPSSIQILAYATQPYAGYIEFGTSRWKYMYGVPYIRPALREAYADVLGSDFVENRVIPSIYVWYPTTFFG